MGNKKYWADEVEHNLGYGINLDIRSNFAWELIKSHPNIAGVEGGEDSTGRAKIILQSASNLVKRSFEIVDIFFDTVETRGEIREKLMSAEESAQKRGQLRSIEAEEEYNFVRKQRESRVEK